jgi:biopolymer transport protein ExbD
MADRLAARFAPRLRRLALTPLIDVVFLLLLFFMLTTTFSRLGEIDLAPAAGGGVAPDDRAPRLRPAAPDLVRVNAVETALDALLDRLDPLAGAADEGFVILVSLSGAPSAQRLVDLLAVLRARPDWQVRVLE